MPKPEWGVKRQCANCGARFYDLNADPATCPECGTVFEIEALIRGKRARPPVREAVAEPAAEIDDVEIDDDDVIETDDDADVDEAAAVTTDDADDEDLEPAEEVLLDDDVDEDEDEDLGDFGGEEGDDDRR